MKRSEIIARRREFVISGYKHKYKTLSDVGFDGEWVTPYQIVSNSETGPVLVAHYWLDAPSVRVHRDVLKEQGWLPSMPFNKVLDAGPGSRDSHPCGHLCNASVSSVAEQGGTTVPATACRRVLRQNHPA